MNNYSRCAAQHFGPWAIEERWFNKMVDSINAGTYPIMQAEDMPEPETYELGSDGIALINIDGHMTKGRSSLGGTSTVATRKAIRAAATDNKVRGILLQIESPGGTVAGTGELADEVRAAGRMKPVHAFGEDTLASAAYAVGVQAQRLSVNRAAEVDSIGTFAIVKDTSKLHQEKGIKTHIVSAGKYKGTFVDGVEIGDEQLEWVQEIVNDLNEQFLSAVARGRGVAKEQVRKWADGRTWIGAKARDMGLVDAVETADEARQQLRKAITENEARQAKGRLVRERLRIA